MKKLLSMTMLLTVLAAHAAQAESTCIAKRIHYIQLQKGSSYLDTARIIGCLGEETFGYDSGGLVMKNYTWRGDDYGSLTITFVNDRLDATMQLGLK